MDTTHEQTLDTMLGAFRSFLLVSATITREDATRAKDAVLQAESIGFVIDPTQYRHALFSGSLDRQKQIVTLFIETREKLLTIFPGDARMIGL